MWSKKERNIILKTIKVTSRKRRYEWWISTHGESIVALVCGVTQKSVPTGIMQFNGSKFSVWKFRLEKHLASTPFPNRPNQPNTVCRKISFDFPNSLA